MDIQYLLWLQSIREQLGYFAGLLFHWISQCCYIGVVIILIVYWAIDKKKGLLAFTCLVISNTFMQTVKNICCVNRPWIRDRRIHPFEKAIGHATGYSFPSGHTTIASACYGALAKIYAQYRWLCVILILLIGFSRNFLGVHTPQDVIIGMMIGLCSVFIVSFLGKYHVKLDSWWALFLLVDVTLVIFTVMKSYPQVVVDGKVVVDVVKMQKDALASYGVLAGFIVGHVFEKRYVCFATDCVDLKCGLKRVLIGIVLVGLLYCVIAYGLASIFEVRVISFLKGSVCAFAGIGVVPLFFEKNENN